MAWHKKFLSFSLTSHVGGGDEKEDEQRAGGLMVEGVTTRERKLVASSGWSAMNQMPPASAICMHVRKVNKANEMT